MRADGRGLNASRLLVRSIKVLVGLLLLLYLAACAYLYFAQRRLMYFPMPVAEPTQAEPVLFTRSGLDLRAWVVHPGKPCAVLYFGGNGERVERLDDFFAGMLGECSVYLLAYRGYSGNPGQPNEQDLLADALAHYDRIAGRHADVSVIGRSLGSGIAAHVAAQRPLRRLVLVTPFDSIVSVAQGRYPMFPVQWLLQDKYESWRRAPRIRARTLILIAGRDQVVPRANSEHLVSRFPIPPEVLVFPGASHNSIAAEPGYAARIEQFLQPAGLPQEDRAAVPATK